jgi:chemotaxis methyl-accepting protein methylase
MYISIAMTLPHLSHLLGKFEDFQVWRNPLNCLKSKKIVHCKNIFIYFDKGLQQFQTLQIDNHKFEA